MNPLGLLGQNNPVSPANLTAQQQAQMQQVATMLQQKGQNKENEKFASPWQVAGQWAQALGGREMQNQLGQNYATINQQGYPASTAPSVGDDVSSKIGADNLPWSGGGG